MNVKINLEFTVNNAQWDFKIVWVFESSQTQEKKFGYYPFFSQVQSVVTRFLHFPQEKELKWKVNTENINNMKDWPKSRETIL